MGVNNMKRVIAVAACGVTLTACSSWMPSFDMPSMPSFGGGGGPTVVSLAVETDPAGAQASVQGGASCVTPCRLNVTAAGPFAVNVALNGYVPQSVPVRVLAPDDPRLGAEDGGNAGPRLEPNPVYVELERAPAPVAPPPRKKPKPKPAVAKRTPPPAPANAAPPATAPTNAVAPTAAPPPPPPPPQQPAATAPWPMPK
jgi:hypothetical protein